MKTIFDNGEGFEYPIYEKNNICIFDIGNKYSIKNKITGKENILNKPQNEYSFFKILEKKGWNKIII